jgi:hypothetical protein
MHEGTKQMKFPKIQNNIIVTINLLVTSFKNLYPDIKRRIIINPDPNLAVKPNKKIPLGFTDFSDNKKDPILIHISANIGLSQMLNILAHELAHVARGEEFTIKNEHDAKWKKIYSDIRKEYHRLLKEKK